MGFMVTTAAFMLFAGIAANVLAGGEPGAGCEDPTLKYDPAPYIGDIELEWVVTSPELGLGAVYAYGSVEQAGNTNCFGSFSGLIIDDIPLDTFQNWKSNDLRQTCIKNESDPNSGVLPFPCHNDGGSLEVVAVGGLKVETPTSLEAKFVIMELE